MKIAMRSDLCFDLWYSAKKNVYYYDKREKDIYSTSRTTLLKRIFSADTWVFRICTLLLEVSYADTRFFNMIMSWHQSDVLNEQKRSKVRIRSVNNVESIRLYCIITQTKHDIDRWSDEKVSHIRYITLSYLKKCTYVDTKRICYLFYINWRSRIG